ncbi:metalloregulator ArsR/SmtB family transcription factor [Dethiosulfovibrio sp. F2B]|uniref:ArsR/SmtB family transcription factor n=1 Tax=Dethiosulfovibrio faecalis TaxID=2720018 RepID=UPI001F2BF708|nr:metalloregulator ArsR/SmtB family transcription factor [Dethiosulfovibrio faecalis]MCF4151314.1 metalloregulator ArsR/SmtB family transcription factor [Dethiosulfovibrio faecalis]
MADKDRTVAVFKALAHPLRLEIVRRLGGGEVCACEIARWFESDRTTVSKHLAVLRDAEVLKDRREGQKILYSIALPCVSDMIRCVDSDRCAPICPKGGCRDDS